MEHLSVQAVLGLIGVIILIGLAGELFFKKTGVPSVLFLVALGVVLGPGLGLVEETQATRLAPYFGTLALLIILFDGGLNMQIGKVLKEAPIALGFALTVFSLTVLGTGAFMVWGLGETWSHGFLLGAIVGGTSGAIVIPVVSQLGKLRDQTKVILSLESAFSDVFVVVLALAIMGMLTKPGGQGNMADGILSAFLAALLLAVVAGAIWARLLAWLHGHALSYMLTLAAILVLYDLAELLGASGAITILLFGLVLGNMERIVARLALPVRRAIGYELDHAQFALDTFLKRLNEEISFLVRTFFYVLLGLIFDLSAMTDRVAATGAALFAIGLAVRWAVTEGLGRFVCGWTGGERRVITAMLPRGLAAAVMAFLPAGVGIAGTERFPLYVLSVIALSVLYMTVVLVIERRRAEGVVASVPAA